MRTIPKPHIATGPSESDLLREFWWFVSGTTDAVVRLDWLMRLAVIHVRVKWGWKAETTRKTWNQQREWLHGKCFVCGKVRALQTHHVIQVQYGGSNLSRNRVAVCTRCHQAIHPWMLVRKGAGRMTEQAV